MLARKIAKLTIAASLVIGMPVFSQPTGLSDLEAVHNARYVITEPGKPFDKEHWAYKSLESLSQKYGLLLGDFNENKPITRNEAAVLLVNLIGKIEEQKTELNESDKMQINIMKNEFSKELTTLTGRVEKLEAADKSSVKFGFADSTKIMGGIQAQYTGNFSGTGADARSSNFSLPVVDMTFAGKIRPHLDYFINTYPSRNFNSTTNGPLGDVWMSTDIIPNNTLYLGQKRKPLGMEGMQSNYTLSTIERAQIARIFGDKRDTGVSTAGNWKFISYDAGVYNGSGINSTDNNSGVEMASMVTFNPLYAKPQYGALKLGGVFDNNTTTYKNKLYGAVAQYISPAKKLKLQSEYLQQTGYLSSSRKASGLYVLTTYFLTDKLELVARYDVFDPNLAARTDRKTEYTGGANYYFYGQNLKLQADFVYVQNWAGDDSARFLVMSQYRF